MGTSSYKGSLGFIFITILVDVIGVGIIVPVLPSLIEELTGKGTSEAAGYGGLLMLSFALMQFLFAPVMGELSDRFGRRPILLLALTGLGIDYIFHAFAPSITWLFIGRILAGITGASYTVATAYVADISTLENKAKNFGLIGAAFGLGFIIGPVIGGVCAEWGVEVPFLVAAGITLLNVVYGYFFVPESLPPEKRRKFILRNANPVGSLVMIRSYPAIRNLVIAFFLANMAGQALPSTWPYFLRMQFGWEEWAVGLSLTFVGLLVAFSQGFLVGKVVKKFGDEKVILWGFLFWTSGMVLFAFMVREWMVYVFVIPYVLGGVAGPTLQSYLSNKIPDNEQGRLQGALTGLISITTILSPLMMTGLFYFFTKDHAVVYFPGAPYILAGGLLLGGTIFVFSTFRKTP